MKKDLSILLKKHSNCTHQIVTKHRLLDLVFTLLSQEFLFIYCFMHKGSILATSQVSFITSYYLFLCSILSILRKTLTFHYSNHYYSFLISNLLYSASWDVWRENRSVLEGSKISWTRRACLHCTAHLSFLFVGLWTIWRIHLWWNR